MSFAVMRTNLTNFIGGEPYTAIDPGTATNYPTLGLVRARAVLDSGLGEEGTVEIAHDIPSIRFIPDDPGAVGVLDAQFHTELKEVALKFWELYLIAIAPA